MKLAFSRNTASSYIMSLLYLVTQLLSKTKNENHRLGAIV